MTLEKAIAILELNLKEVGKKMPADTQKALALSVEAMKRELSCREGQLVLDENLLPGETTEPATAQTLADDPDL